MTLRLRLRSTLFPYTTLFRSERDVRAHAVELEEEAVRPHVRVERAEEPEDRREVDGDQLVPFLVGQRQGGLPVAPAPRGDGDDDAVEGSVPLGELRRPPGQPGGESIARLDVQVRLVDAP